MSESKQEIGLITWTDLTVVNADKVKYFYPKVVGWKVEMFDMGGYNDFNMNCPQSEKPVAGICHSRGVHAGFPPQWLIDITVENVDKSAKSCTDLGGKLIVAPKKMGSHGRFCVIEDPAGAVAAPFEPSK